MSKAPSNLEKVIRTKQIQQQNQACLFFSNTHTVLYRLTISIVFTLTLENTNFLGREDSFLWEQKSN